MGETLRQRRAVVGRLVRQEGVEEGREWKEPDEEASQEEESNGAVEEEGRQTQEEEATERVARVHLKRYRNE